MTLILPRRRAIKPGVAIPNGMGIRLVQDHPLVRGLGWALVPGVAGGIDLTGNSPVMKFGSGPPTQVNTPEGPAYAPHGSNGAVNVSTTFSTNLFVNVGNMTMYYRGILPPSSSPSFKQLLTIGTAASGTGSAGLAIWDAGFDVATYYNGGRHISTSTSYTGTTIGRPFSLASFYPAGNVTPAIYLNGLDVGSGSFDAYTGSTAWGASPVIQLDIWGDSTAACLCALIWNRQLSAAELLYLDQDWSQIIEADTRARYFFSGVAAVTLPWNASIVDMPPAKPLYQEQRAALNLTPATLPPPIAGMAWEGHSRDDLPVKPLYREQPASIALTPATLPVATSGMAFHEPPDPLPIKPLYREQPQAIVLMPSAAAPVSGMAWFEPADDLPRKPLYREQRHGFEPSPATLPVKIAGMAFHQPPDIFLPGRRYTNDPPAFGVPPIGIVTLGWFRDHRDQWRQPTPFDFPPALGTLPAAPGAGIAGMAWFTLFDEVPRRPLGQQPGPALALTPATLPVGIAGMGWFEPPDPLPGRPLYREQLLGFSPSPATLPPKIAGMAWMLTADVFQPGQRRDQSPPAFAGFPPGAPVGVSGMAWFTIFDELARRPLAQQPGPALALTPATLPVAIAGMGWFAPPDAYEPGRRFINDPPAVVLPLAVTVGIIGMGWFAPADDIRRRFIPIDFPGLAPPLATPIVLGWINTALDLLPSRRLALVDVGTLARVPVPGAAISGMAWFTPPDYLPLPPPRPHWGPALALTPATLPVNVSGMGWFRPFEELPYARPVYGNSTSQAGGGQVPFISLLISTPRLKATKVAVTLLGEVDRP